MASDEDDFYRRSREELYPKVRDSALTIHIHSDEPDPKQCMEFGAMVLFDKPIIVVVPKGRKDVPANVRRVASAIIDNAEMGSEATAMLIQAAITRVLENDARAKGPKQ